MNLNFEENYLVLSNSVDSKSQTFREYNLQKKNVARKLNILITVKSPKRFAGT